MEEALRARLLATAALAGVPVNWGSHPQGAGLPGIVLNVVSGNEGLTLKGRDGLSVARVQVDCLGVSYAAAKGVARNVITALNAYRATNLRLVAHVATRDSREGGSNEAERPYRTSLDFMTHWRATT
jgi:hypothetical protein